MPTRREVALEWLAAQPLVIPAVGIIAGIVTDSGRAVPLAFALSLFIFAGVIIIFARRKEILRHVGLFLAALAVGSVLYDLSFRRWPDDHLVQYTQNEPTFARVTGTIVNQPRVEPVQTGRIKVFAQAPRTRFLLEAETIRGKKGPLPVSGLVSVNVRQPALKLHPGDRIELFGKIYRPLPPSNPGTKDWSLHKRRQRVLVAMSCSRSANLKVISKENNSIRILGTLRQRLRDAMLQNTCQGDVPGSQLLSALVLGQRSAVEPELNQAFVDSGTVHYLSVSGAHVGMLMSAVWLIGLCLGTNRRKCAWWTLILVTFYAIVAEPRAAIIRSALMADVFCIALLLRRPARSVNWLALAAIILLIVRPSQLFEPGFQMSFLTLLGLVFLSPRIYAAGRKSWRRLRGTDDPLLDLQIQRRLQTTSTLRQVSYYFARGAAQWLAIGIAAWLTISSLGAYHFHQVALWGWLNTVLLGPVVWLILVLGLAKTILTVIFKPLAMMLGWPLAKLTDGLIWFTEMLAKLPGSGMHTPAIPLWLVVLALSVLAFWILVPWLRLRARWVLLAFVGLALTACLRLAPPGRSDTLRLHVLSIGDGCATAIELPNGKTFLYDLGSRPPFDIERWALGPLLDQRCIYDIDRMIISHPNLDHYSSVPDLWTRREVAAVISPPHFAALSKPGSASNNLLQEAQDKAIPWHNVVRGEQITGTGRVKFDVLWPPPIDDLAISEVNDSSLVLRISYAGRRILLCGDIEELPQEELLARQDLAADVLMLPHHGSMRDNTCDFFEAVNPSYCIRSTGQRDRHTTNGLLKLMKNRTYYNTADDGAVTVTITPQMLTVQPFQDRR